MRGERGGSGPRRPVLGRGGSPRKRAQGGHLSLDGLGPRSAMEREETAVCSEQPSAARPAAGGDKRRR